MVDLWTLGGLSWRELLRRTARESWEDDVYGQAARLAFYHFLALFPALLLAATVLARFPGTGARLLANLQFSLGAILPPRASQMVSGFLSKTGSGAAERSIWFAILGSVWASLNGTWAVMSGLNAAYEVKEQRPWWRVTLIGAGLTLVLALLVFSSLVLIQATRQAGEAVIQILHWPLLAVMLLLAFAIFYRFAPNLPDRELRWSTPGAVIAVVLWLCASLLFRAYIAYQASRYDQVYGDAGSLAILLLWLYLTAAAILIGGEANSEIENAAAQHGHPDAGRPGEHREGGVTPRRA